jgi:F0F1-type ATP synthase epsilon subunit
LLLETYERTEEIDTSRAENALQRAEERIKAGGTDTIRNKESLERAANRLKVSKR